MRPNPQLGPAGHPKVRRDAEAETPGHVSSSCGSGMACWREPEISAAGRRATRPATALSTRPAADSADFLRARTDPTAATGLIRATRELDGEQAPGASGGRSVETGHLREAMRKASLRQR